LIDATSSASLSASIAKYIDDSDKKSAGAALLTQLLMRPMQLASYFCAGSIKNETDYGHYALNVP
jgi:exoribonuclease R